MRMCARCKKCVGVLIEKLWNGPNGFRKYKVCEKCAREIAMSEGRKLATPAGAQHATQ